MDNSVYAIGSPYETQQAVTKAIFSKTDTEGISFMPWTRYDSYLSGVEDRSQISYLF